MKMISKILMSLLFLALIQICVAQKPGDVASNAKYLDGDFIYPFNQGSAIIKKGQSTGLINASGEMIVLFNKYNIMCCIVNQSTGFSDQGFFELMGGELLTSRGKLIGDNINSFKILSSGNYAWSYSSKGVILADRDNKQVIIPDLKDALMTSENEGLIPFTTKQAGGGNKSGYKNLKGKIIVPAIYEACFPFSDGFGLIGKKNDVGELKYGFIDNTGKLVIDFLYSVKPSSFYNGLAIVYPKGYENFYCAFINKKGETIKKYTDGEVRSHGTFDQAKCVNGIRLNVKNGYVLESNGNVLTPEEYLNSLGIKKGSESLLTLLNPVQSGIVCFKREYDSRKFPNKKNTLGFIVLQTNKIIEGPFEYGIDFNKGAIYFDNISRLAYASFRVDKNTVRSGFINEDGVFVILLKEKSKF